MSKRKLLIDFDGTLAHYPSSKDWVRHEYPHGPIDGAIEWLEELCESDEFDIYIYSSRFHMDDYHHKTYESVGRAIAGCRQWLQRHGLPERYVCKINYVGTKIPAHMMIDDRGYQFTGTYPSLDDIKNFKPWNR